MNGGFGTRILAGKAIGDTLARSHPPEPHWYLAAIGGDPQVRGAGYGRALMQHRLDQCDADQHPAYWNPATRTTFLLRAVRLRSRQPGCAGRRRPDVVGDVAEPVLAVRAKIWPCGQKIVRWASSGPLSRRHGGGRSSRPRWR
ncbi:GNAT family N-acetyltransferase [Nocardia sp. NBC_00403]|uniref:GNAT family N-acetyltransferase n=1 Tax=Nocardia sp. NBC_00403 TaxID=2975990 RepID=UPI002E1ECFAC